MKFVRVATQARLGDARGRGEAAFIFVGACLRKNQRAVTKKERGDFHWNGTTREGTPGASGGQAGWAGLQECESSRLISKGHEGRAFCLGRRYVGKEGRSIWKGRKSSQGRCGARAASVAVG